MNSAKRKYKLDDCALRDLLKEKLNSNSRFADNGCVEWTGGINPKDGYGQTSGRQFGKVVKVHRLSFALWLGEIPDGWCVCHTCDNRICINTDHLFLGTKKDNSVDMSIKDRSSNGVVGWSGANSIRQSYQQGMSQIDIAEKFGVSQSAISCILRNKTWEIYFNVYGENLVSKQVGYNRSAREL